MKFVLILVLVVFVVVLFKAMKGKANAGKNGKEERKGSFTAKSLATANEQQFFWKLVDAFPMPENIVLTQVSFGALLDAKDGASRYSFAQKRSSMI